MKMQLQMSDLIVSGQMSQTDISIGDPRMIIHHLIKSVYQYPEITMVQEYASNARDANAENGKGDTPIVIKVPSVFDPNLVISDDGIGITPGRIQNVFVKIGNSTKRDENISDGMFGIGSKIALAYVDQFTVKTIVQEGEHLIRRLYAVVKQDDYSIKMMELGEPHIINSLDDAGDQHTGTSITIGIKKDDIGKVRQAILNKTEFWKVRPTLVGVADSEMAYPERKWFYECDEFRFDVESSHHDSQIIAVINGIPYPVKANRWNDDSGVKIPSFYGQFCINFNVGELSPALNRESLHYDAKTIALIQSRVDGAVACVKSKVKEIINSKGTYLEALSTALSFSNTGWCDASGMVWNGIKINYIMEIVTAADIANVSRYHSNTPDTRTPDNTTVSFMKFEVDHRNRVVDRQENRIHYRNLADNVQNKIPMFYTQKENVKIAALRWYVTEQSGSRIGGSSTEFVCFRGSKAEVEKLLVSKHIGETAKLLVDLDNCGYKMARRTGPKQMRVINKWTVTSHWDGKLETCGYFNQDPKEEGFYFTFDRDNRGTLDIGKNKILSGREVRNLVACIPGMSGKIFGIAKGNVKFLDKSKWKPLNKLLSSNPELAAEATLWQEYMARKDSESNEAFTATRFGGVDVETMKGDSPFRKWLTEVQNQPKLLKPKGKLIRDDYHDINGTLGALERVGMMTNIRKDEKHPIAGLYLKVLIAYPMLACGRFNTDSAACAAITSYVNMCDEKAGLK